MRTLPELAAYMKVVLRRWRLQDLDEQGLLDHQRELIERAVSRNAGVYPTSISWTIHAPRRAERRQRLAIVRRTIEPLGYRLSRERHSPVRGTVVATFALDAQTPDTT